MPRDPYAPPPQPSPSPHGAGPDGRWALTAVALGAFCVQLDSFALHLALPVIRGELPGPAALGRAVSGGYLLAAGALMPLAGRLGDAYGRRRMLRAGLLLFAAAAAACALAPSLSLLVAARVLQGAGAALIMPNGLALLTQVFPGARGRRMTGRALGLAGLATACGPFVGGAVTEYGSWRAVFWLTALPALGAAAAARRTPGAAGRTAARPDAAGAIAATATCAALALGLGGGPWWWAWSAAAVALGTGCVRRARRTAPLLDPALLRDGRYLRLTASGAVANAATVALLFTVPQLLERSAGLSPAVAGLVFLVPAGALAAGGPAAGRVRPAAGTAVMAGCLTVAAVASVALPLGGADPLPLLVAATVAATALGTAGALALTGTQALAAADGAGAAAGVTKAVLTVTAGLGLALPLPDDGPRPALLGAVCLATALGLTAPATLRTLRRLLRRDGRGTPE
ncbi:MFS transporter [Streptomyces catenulae]|uniref:MFS transporter n=1 Tax=Streptomyces catenulae TaxID=66875 RepID=A0ABV2Z426_9ACTN|nr:MFS transporter [Streptomyces catenulae]